MKRLLLGSLALLLAAIGGLGVFGYLQLNASLPQLDGQRPLAGLRAPVTIARDALGVVSLQAQHEMDLFQGLGFVHAQDRFFQMDLLRRAAAGELSELLGAATLELDRRRRLHRMRRVARQTLRQLSTREGRILEAYARGVNAGLAALDARPFEYLLLNQSPMPWRPEDSLLVSHAMAFDLQDEDAERDARLAVLRAALPPAMVEFLVPRGTAWDATLEGRHFSPVAIPGPEVYDLRRSDPAGFPALVAGEPAPAAHGSNAWVVDAAHMQDGRAWLANDMHLGLAVPTTWYRMRWVLKGRQGFEVTGVTLPGAPALVAGSNGHIAWGYTNSYGDWSDRIELQLHPADPQRYRTPDGYFPLDEGLEVIHVRDAADVTLVVRSSHWGPVVEDFRGRPQAVRWLTHAPEATNLGLLDLLHAQDVAAALAVANRAGMPPQNFLVADRHGDIAWTIAGRLPQRGDQEGHRPLSWSQAGEMAWLPPVLYPRLLRPEQGRIWSANARMVGGTALRRIGDGGYALGVRQRQIRDRLLALDRAAPADLLALQLDDRALFLLPWRNLLLSLLGPEAVEGQPLRSQARQFVTDWGARAAVDSVGYRLVAEWRETVHDAVFAALTLACRKLDPHFRFTGFWQDEAPLWALVTRRPPHLLNPRYADWESFLLAALDTVLAKHAAAPGGLATRTWGERNTLRMQHPLARALPALSPWLDMPAVALPGDVHVPRVQTPRAGASERMAVAPGHEDAGYFHMPGGQSGHPLSPFYRAGHAAWVEGRPLPFLPGASKHRLVLTPAEGADGGAR